jgi:hypothetical protein
LVEPPGGVSQRQGAVHSVSLAQATQAPKFAQKALAQSERLTQFLPLTQRGQVPPQSTSVSLPFRI